MVSASGDPTRPRDGAVIFRVQQAAGWLASPEGKAWTQWVRYVQTSPIELTGQLEPSEPIIVPKISDALMETYLWLSGYEDETQGPCASRCIIDAAAKFACAASRNDRRTISGRMLKIDSQPAYTARTPPGREPWEPRSRVSVIPSRHHQHRLRGRPHLVRSVFLAGVGSGGEHTSSYLGIQTRWVYVWE